MRRAKFRVSGRDFNGVREATVVVEADGPHALMRVRPLRRRQEYVLCLEDVASMVIWHCVKAEVAARKATRKRGAK